MERGGADAGSWNHRSFLASPADALLWREMKKKISSMGFSLVQQQQQQQHNVHRHLAIDKSRPSPSCLRPHLGRELQCPLLSSPFPRDSCLLAAASIRRSPFFLHHSVPLFVHLCLAPLPAVLASNASMDCGIRVARRPAHPGNRPQHTAYLQHTAYRIPHTAYNGRQESPTTHRTTQDTASRPKGPQTAPQCTMFNFLPALHLSVPSRTTAKLTHLSTLRSRSSL